VIPFFSYKNVAERFAVSVDPRDALSFATTSRFRFTNSLGEVIVFVLAQKMSVAMLWS
jgi:hypothetical protein